MITVPNDLAYFRQQSGNLMVRQIQLVESIFLPRFDSQGDLNKDPTVWLDGYELYPISLIMSSTYSWIYKFSNYKKI